MINRVFFIIGIFILVPFSLLEVMLRSILTLIIWIPIGKSLLVEDSKTYFYRLAKILIKLKL